MTWLAVSTGRRALRSPDARAAAEALIPCGTLLIEASFHSEGSDRQILLDLTQDFPWQQSTRLSFGPSGDLLLEQRSGSTLVAAVCDGPTPDQGSEFRIQMSWHGPQRIGLITVENLETGATAVRDFEAPAPWTFAAARALVSKRTKLHPSVSLVALSDQVEPTGMSGGFAAGTLVDTPNGPIPVEDLQPNDEVLTSRSGILPVKQIVSYEVPAAGRFAPIALHAPFFGLERDLTVAPDHRLLVWGADAEYLFGAEEVLIEARYLNRFASGLPKHRPATQRYVHVLIGTHVCLSVGGGWGESLYLGDLADHPARHAMSPLRRIPSSELPRHTAMVGPELGGYEAAMLVSSLCA